MLRRGVRWAESLVAICPCAMYLQKYKCRQNIIIAIGTHVLCRKLNLIIRIFKINLKYILQIFKYYRKMKLILKNFFFKWEKFKTFEEKFMNNDVHKVGKVLRKTQKGLELAT